MVREQAVGTEPGRDAARAGGRGPTPGPLVTGVQATAGNRAVLALMAAGQAKLEVGAADDPYEREADAVAHQVVEALSAPGAGTAGPAPVQRAISRLQRRPAPAAGSGGPASAIGAAGGPVGAETERSIASALQGGGSALGSVQRRGFEGAMGADLSGVRLHTGTGAHALNDQIGARAFTVGSDIFLGRGTPDLGSRPGQELLAHELTHTVQQGASTGTAARSIQRWWPWSSTPSGGGQTGGQTGTGQQQSPPPDPKVVLKEAEDKLAKARQRLQEKKNQISNRSRGKGGKGKKRGNQPSVQSLKQDLVKLEDAVKKAEEERDEILNAPTAKSYGDLLSWGGFFGSQRSGGTVKEDWTVQDKKDKGTGENTSWLGTNEVETDHRPKLPEQRPLDEKQTKEEERQEGLTTEQKQAEEDGKKAREFVKSVLDIPLVEINIQPDETELGKVGRVDGKMGMQGGLTASLMKAKNTGKIELSLGKGGKYAGDMGPAWVAGEYLNSSTGVEGFVGAKGSAEYEAAVGWERVALGGKASAFLGGEGSFKTEAVLKIAGKEAGRFKGGLGVTYGVGGEIGGTLAWPWGGDLEIKSTMKLTLGLGVSYEIDFKLPTATWGTWAWDYVKSWLW